ncbi:Na+/H+ antiporter subunit E [Micrococcus sp.]|uniref:Na+/H+ antiporter subunit E n=1 Tax=Micrococcus sp. TaxID=1271 RepID=UPI0026DC2068|nr:Na+/H+ antiporter subunit E [Micrococcus sp.]MDO4240266.1 Na+/H+ antiporter subunit E [Micrococcus sp.]
MPATERTAVTGGGPGAEEGRAAAERRGTLLRQWPLLLGMVLLWCAVWQDFALHVVLTGVVFSLLVQVLFPMPPVPFGDRFNPWHALVFTGRFLWDVVRSSVSVARVILTRRGQVRSSVVRVPLRSHDDIVMTLVSHALALVPGSIVLDVDRARAVLYLHVLDVDSDEDMDAYRATALEVEAGIIRAVGSTEDMALLRAHPDSAPDAEGMAERRRHPAYRAELLPDTPGPAGPTDAERGGPR